MLQATLLNQTYALAESWDELRTDQLEQLARLVRVALTKEEIRVGLLLYTLGIRHDWRGVMRIGRRRCPIETEDVYVASQVFDFLFAKDKDDNDYLDVRLTHCPYHVLEELDYATVSPQDALTNISYERYVFALTYSDMLPANPSALPWLIASLYAQDPAVYRHPKPQTDLPLSEEKRQVLQWYWLGSLQYLSERYPALFSAGGSSANHTHYNTYEAQERILDTLTHGDAVKKRAYKSQPLYDVLFSINYTYENPLPTRQSLS